MVAVGFVGVVFVCSEGYSNDFIFSHEEFGVVEGLSECLEVIGGHVFEGEYVDVFVSAHEVVNFIDDELFMFSGFGLYFFVIIH